MTEQSQTGAIFLSYAREDADAARRIADALRAFGLVVWFDQAELRGGDSWDQKIKKQIRDCALFIPVVSATTQDRGEGYFRREWKLGVERTHDMASGVPFIMPVVIDDTVADEAAVPEEFLRYQWTHLRHGVPSSQFVEQVKHLLEAPRKVSGGRARENPNDLVMGAAQSRNPTASFAGGRRTALPIAILGGLSILAAGAVILFVVRSGHSPGTPAQPAASTSPSGPEAPRQTAEAAPIPSDKSIAVLPFENMSADKDDNAFFADGIHEDILTNLALVKQLRVVSRTSVMQYRATTKSIRQIAGELGVAYILEGSVRRSGGKVRVTGQLIRASTDEHMWAKAYDRDLTDIFTIQGELSQAIADALQAVLSPQEKSLLERRLTESPEAYDLYLKARRKRENFDLLLTAEPLLRSAVEIDPKFSAAWAELGSIQAFAYFNNLDHTESRLAKAKEAIDTAVRLAPDEPAVIEGAGDYYYYGYRDYDKAAAQYHRLAELRPNDGVTFFSLGLIYRRQGRLADAYSNFRRALELEPNSFRYGTEMQFFLTNCRRYDESEVLGRRMVQLFPNRATPAMYLALNEFYVTSSEESFAAFKKIKFDPSEASLRDLFVRLFTRISGDLNAIVQLDREKPYDNETLAPRWAQDADLAVDLAATGDMPAARTRADQAISAMKAEIERQPKNALIWSSLAEAYLVEGDSAEALRCTEKAMELVPESRDAVDGPNYAASHAIVLAWAGEKGRAIDEIARLLQTPFGLEVNILRQSVPFVFFLKPLHGDPRFEALLNDPKNRAPLF